MTGMWGLLGDFDIDSVYESYEVGSADGVVMGALLFVYMFVVTIVLVNLLIAQMSARYESVMAGSHEVWVIEKINLVEDSKDGKSWLPPPLNFFTFIFYDLPRMMYVIFRPLPSPKKGWKLELEGAKAISASQKLAQKLRRLYIEGQEEVERKETRLESLDAKVTQLAAQGEQTMSQLRKLCERLKEPQQVR